MVIGEWSVMNGTRMVNGERFFCSVSCKFLFDQFRAFRVFRGPLLCAAMYHGIHRKHGTRPRLNQTEDTEGSGLIFRVRLCEFVVPVLPARLEPRIHTKEREQEGQPNLRGPRSLLKLHWQFSLVRPVGYPYVLCLTRRHKSKRQELHLQTNSIVS